MPKFKRLHKACVGCDEHFTTFRNYDYCPSCEVNGSRYLSKDIKDDKCSECDGSGWIKFRGQPKRPCKLCALTKPMNKKTNPKKLTAEEKEENFWDQVDQLAQEKIYHLFTTNIPFQNIPLIKEPYRYEDAQQKKVGLFLWRDVDYRTLLGDVEEQYYEVESRPSQETLAEEIALWYCAMVMKSLITDLSEYSGYEPSFFSHLTER